MVVKRIGLLMVDRHGARVTVVHYVPIWIRHPDHVVLPVQPIPDHLG